MSLKEGKYEDIPKGAVILSRYEAIEHQYEKMKNWPYKKDTMFFRYGLAALSGASILTSLFINNHYRRKLLLHNYGQISSYLSTTCIPTFLGIAGHLQVVLPNVLLQDTCAVCTEIKAASIQATLGCVVPTLLATLSSFSTASSYATYNLPYLTQEPMKIVKLWIQFTKPIGNKLFGLFLANAFLGSVVTYLESQDVLDVARKRAFLDQQYEAMSRERMERNARAPIDPEVWRRFGCGCGCGC